MCGGSSSTTKPPNWLTQGAESFFKKNLGFLNSPVREPSYLGDKDPLKEAATPGHVVAGLTGDQNSGFEALRNLYATGTDTSAADTARALVSRASETMDPSQTSEYMNPYIQGTLDPTIRNIDQERSAQNQNLNASAISAGAFGDARHGILGGQIDKQADQAVGDASNQAYSQAWASALQSQQARASNFLQSAQEGYGIYSQDRQRQYGDANSLLQSGQAQQQQQQNLLDARSKEWQTEQQDRYDKLAAMMSLLTGTAMASPKTTNQDNGMGGLFSMFGSGAGGLLSMFGL